MILPNHRENERTGSLIFLGAGLLFWWPVVNPTGGKQRLGFMITPLYLLTAASTGGLIGGILLAIDRPVYETYRLAPRIWGISAQVDQELGGLAMMLGDATSVIAVLVVFAKYVVEEERNMRAAEVAAQHVSEGNHTGS